jgi:hypothetical protein
MYSDILYTYKLFLYSYHHYVYFNFIQIYALFRKLESDMYYCSTITLIVPLSATIRADIVQVIYD